MTNEPVILYVEDDPQSRKLMSMLLKGRMKLPYVTILEDSQDFMANVDALDPKPNISYNPAEANALSPDPLTGYPRCPAYARVKGIHVLECAIGHC